jgi:hypothetical protein
MQAGRLENVIGWYHSHPGYGCWLSGIDVSTQMLNQQFQEPFLAVVIDPTRTVSAGKVEIGAFRTYPEGYKPPDDPVSEYQTIPLNKIEDFGVHCKQVIILALTAWPYGFIVFHCWLMLLCFVVLCFGYNLFQIFSRLPPLGSFVEQILGEYTFIFTSLGQWRLCCGANF